MINQQIAGRFDHWLWDRKGFNFYSNRHWLWGRRPFDFVVVQRIPQRGAEYRRRRIADEVSRMEAQ